MKAETVTKRWRQIVAMHLAVTEIDITDGANFCHDLGADSLDTVELLMSAEEEFGIEITDEEAEASVTFGDSIRLIQEKI